ncbi:MAG: mandelate racemase/muconate lactonizing enzyme family protein [Kouleothrix sp.]|nr:mandelate racemase/muconate lactonizing enzyme family protein [Kouleothrix sp.]
MKITSVETFLLRHTLPRPTGPSIWLYSEREALIVKISTDTGLVGWGETSEIAGAGAVIREVCAPIVIGHDPREHRRLWHQIWDATLGHGFAVGAVDIALHDLWGQASGRSVGELYGGVLRERVPAYASALSYVEGVDPAEAWLPEATALAAQGFRAIKMRIGRFAPEHELPLIAQLRAALPPGVRLMADGNAAYTLPAAIRVGRALERIGLHWFEEPMPQLTPTQAEYAGYDTLAAHLDIPIASGEILQSRGAFKALIDGHKCDIVQPDVTICGGIGECLFVADLARLAGLQCIPHCWGGAIAVAAAIHVLSLLPSPTSGPSAETPMLEYDTTENRFRSELLAEPLAVRDGFIQLPRGPGLGIRVDEHVLRRYRV